MKLGVEDLRNLVKGVISEAKKKKALGKKGVSGYPVDDDAEVDPKGFAKSEAHDFSKPSEEGNRYKKQGQSNMGPWTSEDAVRVLTKEIVKEELEMKALPANKAKASAPYNRGQISTIHMPEWVSKKSVPIWEKLGHWFDVNPAKKSKRQKAYESKVYSDIFEARKPLGKKDKKKDLKKKDSKKDKKLSLKGKKK